MINNSALTGIEGIIKSGDKVSARQKLGVYLKSHPDDAEAWYLAARVANNRSQMISFLERSLSIDPFYEDASSALNRIQNKALSPPQTIEPVTVKKPQSNSNIYVYIAGAVFGCFLITIIGVAAIGAISSSVENEFQSIIAEEGNPQPANHNANAVVVPTDELVVADTRPTLPPTWTPVPVTNTPRPTLAPEQGTRQNPYPYEWNADVDEYVSFGIAGDSTIGVFSTQTISNATVESWNMFNDQAGSNEEWLIVNLVVGCDRNMNDSCHYSSFSFNLIGRNGRTYDAEMVAGMPDALSGEVYGDDILAGRLAFIVNSSDSDFLLVYDAMFDGNFFFETDR